jgi:hypothetical protein
MDTIENGEYDNLPALSVTPEQYLAYLKEKKERHYFSVFFKDGTDECWSPNLKPQ